MVNVSIERICHRLKKVVKPILFNRNSNDSDILHIIETDFEHDKYKERLESRMPDMHSYGPDMSSYGTFSDSLEQQQYLAVREELTKTLHISCARKMARIIDFSSDLLSRVSQDLVRMARSEPYGLRGAIIFIIIEQKFVCQKIATVVGDPTTTPTFEVFVTLRENTSRWKALKRAYLTLKGCLLNSPWKRTPIVLASGFQLEKKRLYRADRLSNTLPEQLTVQ